MAVDVNLRRHERPAVALGEVRPRRRGGSRRTTLWIWLFLTPTVVLYGVYTVYPIFASYWFSFVEWNGFDDAKTWVGLQNYRDVLADPLFWNSFKITALFTIAAVYVWKWFGVTLIYWLAALQTVSDDQAERRLEPAAGREHRGGEGSGREGQQGRLRVPRLDTVRRLRSRQVQVGEQ